MIKTNFSFVEKSRDWQNSFQLIIIPSLLISFKSVVKPDQV